MDVGRLIELVRQNVFLYDISHRDYKNPSLKTATWELIASELNESGETCRHKWKTVRDSYIKHKKLLKYTTGKKLNEYIWASHLSFLDKHQVNRRSFYHLANDESYSSQPTPTAAKSSEKLQKPVRQELASMLAISPPPLAPLTSSKDDTSFKFQALKEVRNSTDTTTATKRLGEVDATDLLFLSYSSTFKTFSGRQQALMKIQLAKLFANAELENLDNAENCRDDLERNGSPVIVKTECYSDQENSRNSQSTTSYEDDDENSDDKPLKRIRRSSPT
ncbi:uncharacterized protein LOC111360057 isoform X1 [Spodoptera litura]|uniref:Uncharacterized protein LOC111360057 isoform X1 n=1 Tax=Spodoptera litura TaxID=69820 RepID=A0A9J7IZZ8_SPOLT|nr:uncharacterized protein LOC111360057 isoform X1 [Spodoptera litura]